MGGNRFLKSAILLQSPSKRPFEGIAMFVISLAIAAFVFGVWMHWDKHPK